MWYRWTRMVGHLYQARGRVEAHRFRVCFCWVQARMAGIATGRLSVAWYEVEGGIMTDFEMIREALLLDSQEIRQSLALEALGRVEAIDAERLALIRVLKRSIRTSMERTRAAEDRLEAERDAARIEAARYHAQHEQEAEALRARVAELGDAVRAAAERVCKVERRASTLETQRRTLRGSVAELESLLTDALGEEETP